MRIHTTQPRIIIRGCNISTILTEAIGPAASRDWDKVRTEVAGRPPSRVPPVPTTGPLMEAKWPITITTHRVESWAFTILLRLRAKTHVLILFSKFCIQVLMENLRVLTLSYDVPSLLPEWRACFKYILVGGKFIVVYVCYNIIILYSLRLLWAFLQWIGYSTFWVQFYVWISVLFKECLINYDNAIRYIMSF